MTHAIQTTRNKPGIPARHLPLFPTMGSLQEVVDLAESRLPVMTRNEVVSLLKTYHNTLLAQINPIH